jgi:hypothetical protein
VECPGESARRENRCEHASEHIEADCFMHVVEMRRLHLYLYGVMVEYHTLRASGRAVRGGGDGAERGDVWAEPAPHPSFGPGSF